MAACGSLQHIFKKPMPENPTLLESLSSWNQIKATKVPIEDSSNFTEIFGELHFKDHSESLSSSTLPLSSSSSSSSSSTLQLQARIEKVDKDNKSYSSNNNEGISTKSLSSSSSSDYLFSSSHRKQYHKNSDGFSSMNSESLQLCTEGLGFESSGDVEDLETNMNNDLQNHMPHDQNLSGEFRRSRTSGGPLFPPPISCIGKSGIPWVCFKSYRQDGRLVLKEIRNPTHEFLCAHREDGRLKLQFFQSDDEILQRGEEEEEEEDNLHQESDKINNGKEEEKHAENNSQINTNAVGDNM